MGEAGKVWCRCRRALWTVNARQHCVLWLVDTIYSAWHVSVEPRTVGKLSDTYNYGKIR